MKSFSLLLSVLSFLLSSSAVTADEQPQRRLRQRALQNVNFSFKAPCEVCRRGFILEDPDVMVLSNTDGDRLTTPGMTCNVAKSAGMLGWLTTDECNEVRQACLCTDPTRQSWPDLVGMDAEEAKTIIELQDPNLTVVVLKPGAMVTADYQEYRVWIWTNDDGTVKTTPMIG